MFYTFRSTVYYYCERSNDIGVLCGTSHTITEIMSTDYIVVYWNTA